MNQSEDRNSGRDDDERSEGSDWLERSVEPESMVGPAGTGRIPSDEPRILIRSPGQAVHDSQMASSDPDRSSADPTSHPSPVRTSSLTDTSFPVHSRPSTSSSVLHSTQIASTATASQSPNRPSIAQPSHHHPPPRPQSDSHRPSKRPRYSISMQTNHHQDPHNHTTIAPTTSTATNDDGHQLSEPTLAPSLVNHPAISISSTSSPHHPQQHSSPSKSLNNLPPKVPAHDRPQDLQSLLKNFSDGLHALAPHLISPPPPSAALNCHQSLNSDSRTDQPSLSHPLPHPLHPPWPLISDIDREEIVRLLLQSLKEIGYPAAAMTLEVESGFSLDPSPEITSFRQNVLNGKWLEVDELLLREYLKYCDQSDLSQINSSPLSPVYNKHDSSDIRVAKSLFGVDAHVLKLARFLVIQEKYLELLESRQIRKALVVLRSEIAPLVTPPTQNGSTSNHKPKSPLSGIELPFNNKSSSSSGNGTLAGWTKSQDEDPGVQRLCLLSSLMMCGTSEEVRERAEWDGVAYGSRVKLLEELQELIPPQKLLPHQRLPHLLEQSKTLQRLQCLYHVTNPKISLLSNHTCSRSAFPTETSHVLSRHTDEVWRIEWSHDGLRLASADRAKTCIIWKLKSTKFPSTSNGDSPRLSRTSRFSGPSSPDKKSSSRRPDVTSYDEDLEFEVELVLDRHPAGVACIAWSPDDSVLLTGADSTITMWNTKTGECIATMLKHDYDVGALSWLPDGRSFVSGGLDTNVLFWDLKGQNTHKCQVGPTRINDLAVSPDGKRLVVIGTAAVDHTTEQPQDPGLSSNGTDGSTRPTSNNNDNARSNDLGSSSNRTKQGRIHIFNIADKTQIAMIPMSPDLTCVSISDDSKYALINQSPNQVLLYSLEEQKLIRRYVGQKQGRFIIRSCFGGLDRNFILSGSEDGQIYVWHMETGALIEVLGGHGEGTVNAVAWNSVHPPLFASASDDYTVRIWQAPSSKRLAPSSLDLHLHLHHQADVPLSSVDDATHIQHLFNQHDNHNPPPPPPAPALAPRLREGVDDRGGGGNVFGGEDDEDDGRGRDNNDLLLFDNRGLDDHETIY